MARKKTDKMEAAADVKRTKPVRLELPIEDIERLAKAAKARGLNNAAYARQAVLRQIKEDEGS